MPRFNVWVSVENLPVHSVTLPTHFPSIWLFFFCFVWWQWKDCWLMRLPYHLNSLSWLGLWGLLTSLLLVWYCFPIRHLMMSRKGVICDAVYVGDAEVVRHLSYPRKFHFLLLTFISYTSFFFKYINKNKNFHVFFFFYIYAFIYAYYITEYIYHHHDNHHHHQCRVWP